MAIRNIKPLREESAAGLQNLLDTLDKHRDQLRALEQSVDEWDVWMISFAATGMDSSTRKAWEDELERLEAGGASKSETVATFSTLSSFLQYRGRLLTSVESLRTQHSTNNRPPAPTSASRNYLSLATQANDFDTECPACQVSHYLGHCSRFLEMDVRARKQLVTRSRLCFNCLCTGHMAHFCPSQSVCKHCKAMHHSLIYENSCKWGADTFARPPPKLTHASTTSDHVKSARRTPCGSD
ncbi:uncharacterized protein LOC106638978 [Copidosoma floridanum]|uniref:uncharacterized protein LOC106638978 n=1 Tax=Copidosoma floridanum TaxID=29053 RepID=UPI0006C9475E|nr:uncharacterized protein LOC106638978 [Copidosoma floridanum]